MFPRSKPIFLKTLHYTTVVKFKMCPEDYYEMVHIVNPSLLSKVTVPLEVSATELFSGRALTYLRIFQV